MKKDLTEFAARLKLLLIVMVLIVGSYMVALYIPTPNPYPRTIVRLHNEDIITADGIRSDGWLTECKCEVAAVAVPKVLYQISPLPP